jgi:hypothetical protein
MTPSLLLGQLHTTSIAAAADLATSIGDLSVALVSAAAVMLIILVATAVMTHQRWPKFKAPLFTLIVLVTVATTLVLGGTTVALNLNSSTGGPVHWGSDYQIWACGNQLDLRNPQGLMGNRIGSSTLYEQNDGRIHYDGTPTNPPDDASLGKFMQVVGGEISDSSLVVPLNDQTGFTGQPAAPEQVQPYISTDRNGASARFVGGQSCGTEKGQVQAFAYHFNPDTKTYYQTKLDHPANYELSHTNSSPPGDCVIVEFAPVKASTDHLCYGYGIRDYDRCTEFGVVADKVASCDIRELR